MNQPAITVLINPSGGTAGDGTAVATLQQVLATRLPHATVTVLQEDEDITARARAACAAGAQIVAVAGGDGTINAVAQALVGTTTRLGVLPFGTLNHFAQVLDVPRDLSAAVDLLAAAPTRCVDVGAVNDHYFVNNASLGLYPDLVHLREQHDQGARLAKPLRTALAAWHLARTGTPLPLIFDAPVHHIRQEVWLLFVGNNQYDLGPLHPGQRRRLDRARLDIIVVPARRNIGRVLLGSIREQLPMWPMLRFAAGTFTVEPAMPGACRVAFDGEQQQLDPPFVFRSVPQALWVIAPSSDSA